MVVAAVVTAAGCSSGPSGPSEFLNSPDSSLASIAFVGIWRGAPYDMMIFLAGLAGVGRVLYEASAVDGASRWRRIWHVTLPGLRPVFAILLTLAAIRGLRIFTEVFLLTNGGPDGSTEVLLTLTYRLGLERNELGGAASGTVLLFLVLLVLTVASRLRRREVRCGTRRRSGWRRRVGPGRGCCGPCCTPRCSWCSRGLCSP
ncbi:sugar ABC transporter permease [Streptomyces griseoincarnatus]